MPLYRRPIDSFVPTYIPVDDAFTIPLDKQAVTATGINVDGDIIIDGEFIEVF